MSKYYLILISFLFLCSNTFAIEPAPGYLKEPIDNRFLTPEESLAIMYVEPGFELKLFAQEPNVLNPVVMRFDQLGRLWVVEMVGYMNNIRGTNELQPVGRISILEDQNNDGVMDKSTVFLEKLIEPRAIAFHKNGLLWADTKALYFTEIIDLRSAGKTTVIDPEYAAGHSVEHKPNALLRGLDNWYYNAKSDKRFREINGKWVTEKVEYRNQFGLSMDNYGRLYHGQQNTLLRADIFTPGFLLRNPQLNFRTGGLATETNQIMNNCFNVKVSNDYIFPCRTSYDIRDGHFKSDNPDINQKGLAIRCTSATSHFFYRDNYLPKEYSAFVADPALHLIKAISISRENGIPIGKNTLENREIISNPDTRCRPVEVQSAPDGTLFIADMYHGILQHKAFMNQHLDEFIKKNNLEVNNEPGRIYRLTVKDKKPNTWKSFANLSVDEVISSLGSESPWARDTAQRLLVDGIYSNATEKLKQFFNTTPSALGKLHTLWTLAGLGIYDENLVLTAFDQSDSNLLIQASLISWNLPNSAALSQKLSKLLSAAYSEATPYIIQRLANFNDENSLKTVAQAYEKWNKQPFFAEALLSGGGAHTEAWLNSLPEQTFEPLKKRFKNAIIKNTPAVKPKLTGADLEKFERGSKIFTSSCFACHGANGEGLKDMGPPLNPSNWVTGDKETLISILLKGMEGEITVNGVNYKPTYAMNAFDALMTDDQIADVLTFIRNNWNNHASPINLDEVKAVREKLKDRKLPFSQKDFPNHR